MTGKGEGIQIVGNAGLVRGEVGAASQPEAQLFDEDIVLFGTDHGGHLQGCTEVAGEVIDDVFEARVRITRWHDVTRINQLVSGPGSGCVTELQVECAIERSRATHVDVIIFGAQSGAVDFHDGGGAGIQGQVAIDGQDAGAVAG